MTTNDDSDQRHRQAIEHNRKTKQQSFIRDAKNIANDQLFKSISAVTKLFDDDEHGDIAEHPLSGQFLIASEFICGCLIVADAIRGAKQ